MQILSKLFLLVTVILSSVQTLQFNSSGYFTIVQFTDIHMGKNEEKDALADKLLRNVLSWVNPDLVVISGDGASGNEEALTPGWFESQWNKFTAPIVEAQIPYAYTLGNHDDEGDLTRRQVVRLDSTSPYSIRNESEGIPDTANFRVPVYSSQNDSQLAAHLWVLDSGSFGCEDIVEGSGCIERDVVEWYDEESQKVKAEHGTNVHHLAYFHIALPEYIYVYNDKQIYGNSGDEVHCSVKNTGFFETAKKNGDISAMFVGHDHDNDFGGWYQGIELAYGRKSGYRTYGDYHGARVVVLKENYDDEGNLSVTREHYVIDENGEIEYPTSYHYREGARQISCPYSSEEYSIGEESANPYLSSSGDSLFSQLQKILLFALFILYFIF